MILAGPNKQAYDAIHWPDYTLDMLEVSCKQWKSTLEYKYLVQVKFFDPLASSPIAIVVDGGYRGSNPTITNCISPFIPNTTKTVHERPAPFQFPLNYVAGCDLSDLPKSKLCANTPSCGVYAGIQQIATIDKFPINSRPASHCSIREIMSRPWCPCATPPPVILLSIEDGIALYMAWLGGLGTQVLHVFTNYAVTGSEVWTFRTMAPGAWGSISVAEQAVWFRNDTADGWTIVTFTSPIIESQRTTTQKYNNQTCAMTGPTYGNCTAGVEVVYPAYEVDTYGVNGGVPCVLNFTHAPYVCDSTPPASIPSVVDHYAADVQRVFSSDGDIAILSLLCVFLFVFAGSAVSLYKKPRGEG
jgi:hypothetical protein